MRKILVFKNIAKFFFILVVVILFVFPSCKVSKTSHLSNIDSTNIVKQPESLVDTDYYLTVQRMPEFQGGDINTFISYLQKQIKYPKAALTKKKQGLTAIQIGIDCFGAVHALAILKSSGSNLLDN